MTDMYSKDGADTKHFLKTIFGLVRNIALV